MNFIPSVSVLIPCYNNAKHIQTVIQSVRNQTRPPNEIIIVDDASTDHSVAVVKDCNVKLVCHETNRGPAVARNTAFSASTGEIIVFVDADAYADPQMIENILRVYENAPDLDRLGGVGGRGIETCTEETPNRWRCLHARQDFGENPQSNVEYLFGLCCSYPRDVFEKVSGFDDFYRINAGEDYDIGLRIRKAGYRLAYAPNAFIYHQHCDTIESLKRVQKNWTYWSFIARKRNGISVIKAYLGVFRHLLADTLYDFFYQRDLQLAKIDLDLFFIKINAILNAWRAIKDHDGQNT